MDDNCGEWVECIGAASRCGELEVGMASGSGWNLWVLLVGVVDLSLLLLHQFFFAASSLLFFIFYKCFSFLFQYFLVIKFYVLKKKFHAV